MNRSWDMAQRSTLSRSSTLGPPGRLEELVPEDSLIVEPLQVMARNGIFLENRSTFTMRTSHCKAHISDTYTKQPCYMQEMTEYTPSSNSGLKKLAKPESKGSTEKQHNMDKQIASPNNELKRFTKPESKKSSEKQQKVDVKEQYIVSKTSEQPTSSTSEQKKLIKPESKRSSEKQQSMNVKKQHVISKMREQSASPNGELKKLVNPESKRSSEKQQNMNVKKQHVESTIIEHTAPSNSQMEKLTNLESKQSPEKQQNMDIKKRHVEFNLAGAKQNLNSSDAKGSKVLANSATTIEPYNLATTSTKNRISEDSGEDSDVDQDEEDDDSDVDNEGTRNEERKAPLELMGEFLKAIMDRDYKLSSKLCQMILIYEPENPEAQQFKILLDMKIQLDEAASIHQNEEDDTESDSSDEDKESSNEDSDESESSDEESNDSSGSEEST
ncbi:glutamate-rich protein 2 isoform X1 [Chiloscyllium punctatum]|uniref:glutamate-rich protein 2 isoform X1 n=2 Tax=Chiloscyllium punctatum TaxID=137246 RepID=UPI003B635F22